MLSRFSRPRNLPRFSMTPTTSKAELPILILLPTAGAGAKKLFAKSAPITHTGRPPSTSAAERNRPSLRFNPFTKPASSVSPSRMTPVEVRSLYLSVRMLMDSRLIFHAGLARRMKVRPSASQISRRLRIFHHGSSLNQANFWM